MDMEVKRKFNAYTPAELRELYGKNPELFDQLAADATREACIGGSPQQTLKLRRLQWMIDTRLRKGRTPLERMHIMEGIFYDQVYSEKGQLSQLMSGWEQLLGAFNATEFNSRQKPKIRLLKK